MIKLAYIAAPSYSGSTLLTFLLNAHARIATVGELKWGTIDLETYQCSCGELLRECEFWRRVQHAVEAEGLSFDLKRPPTDFRTHQRGFADRIVRARNRGALFESVRNAVLTVSPACKDVINTARATNLAAIRAILDAQNADVFVDASKDPVRLQHLIRTGDYDVYLIHLVRDGRGVINSTVDRKGLTPTIAALDWRRTHEQIEQLAKQLPAEKYLRIGYEKLCTGTTTTLAEIGKLVGVDPTAFADDPSSVEHHILGNRMRLARISDISLDEKWRNELSTEAAEAFEKTAGALNRRYGYQ